MQRVMHLRSRASGREPACTMFATNACGRLVGLRCIPVFARRFSRWRFARDVTGPFSAEYALLPRSVLLEAQRLQRRIIEFQQSRAGVVEIDRRPERGADEHDEC